MPKKNGAANPAVVAAKKDKKPTSSSSTSSEPEKHSKTQTPRDEIDEIFAEAGKKRKKPDNDKEKQPTKKGSAVKDASKRVPRNSASDNPILKKNDGSNRKERRGPRKRTGDGLAIYTEEELGMGNVEAGGTSLCPFDCNCCF